MDRKNPALAGSLPVLRLLILTWDFSRLGCRGNRVLQGVLPLHIRDSLPGRDSGNTGRHIKLSGILRARTVERTDEHGKAGRPEQREASRKEAFFVCRRHERNRFGVERTKNNQTIHVPVNYRAKVADASYRQARSGLAVSGKIILAFGSGIFPENLACRKHPLLPPHSSTGHVKPEYSQLKMKRVWNNMQS